METAIGGFTSTISWENVSADCVVITCSDHRFREQTEEFLKHLGYKHPHIIQFPSGPVASLPLISAFGFLSKAVDKLMEKAMDVTKVRDVICIAHEDCAAYKAESLKLLDFSVRKFSGKSVREIQIEHLRKATSRLEGTLHGINAKAYFAEVVEEKVEGKEKHLVHFKEVPV